MKCALSWSRCFQYCNVRWRHCVTDRAGSWSVIAWWRCYIQSVRVHRYHCVFSVYLTAHLINCQPLLKDYNWTICYLMDLYQTTESTHSVLVSLLTWLSPTYVLCDSVLYYMLLWCVQWQFCTAAEWHYAKPSSKTAVSIERQCQADLPEYIWPILIPLHY